MTRKDTLKKNIIKSLHILPVRKNAILCHNFYGEGFDENPRAIAEALLKEKKYKIYWVLSRPNANLPLPDGVERVIVGTFKYFRAIATSKIWISNVRLPEYFTKRKSQYYIQTWHGDLGMKKIEYDVIDNLDKTYIRCMKNDNLMIDAMLSGSNHFSNLCRTTFKYDGEIIKCGSPKNDQIINSNHDEQKEILKKNLKIKEDNILLYMPTFRNNYDSDPYNIDLESIKKALEASTKSSWKIICKMHPNVPEEHKKINCKDYISADKYGNTQQLILSCDILISDYSSVLFDALLADRIVFTYANDEKEYTSKERSLYFKLSELPFPYFKTSEELIDYIKQGNLKKAKSKYSRFLKDQSMATSGNASETVAKIIEKKCFKK
ncbi:MAG: CDP-glycerol glycerophosphotransferase family protein [Candidatus Saccharibacteria bacterium]|nr:CDP-glycerol glycerophosphotransferase family protein [Candidatus Saccharibacteria bacterium]